MLARARAFPAARWPDGARGWWPVGLAVVLAVVAEFVLLAAWQGNSYWGFSSGVYPQSAREFLHGLVPYRDFAAAQPPPVFLVGALLLAVSDGPGSLHVGLGILGLLTAGLVGLCVWRLERSRSLAVAAVLFAPLLPIALNSHAQLLPETLAAPLIMGGAIGSASESRQDLGGVLLALAAWCKVAFLLPALAVALVAPRRRRALVVLLGSTVLLYGASVAVFGLDEWRETVVAQFQVGRAGLRYAGGLIAQIGWNELPLLVGAAILVASVARGRRERPDRLLITWAAAALGGLVLALTVFKKGSYLNVMVVAEPPLLALAACGAARGWRGGSARARTLVAAAALLLAGQSLSLLASPGDPGLAVRPLASSGLAWQAGPSEVDRDVAAARRCPPGTVYPGNPYVAFLADRAMPGDQPDLFILSNARENARFAARAAEDRRPRCP